VGGGDQGSRPRAQYVPDAVQSDTRDGQIAGNGQSPLCGGVLDAEREHVGATQHGRSSGRRAASGLAVELAPEHD
jgi:hypothetical protein